jgi:hypothetical protein
MFRITWSGMVPKKGEASAHYVIAVTEFINEEF